MTTPPTQAIHNLPLQCANMTPEQLTDLATQLQHLSAQRAAQNEKLQQIQALRDQADQLQKQLADTYPTLQPTPANPPPLQQPTLQLPPIQQQTPQPPLPPPPVRPLDQPPPYQLNADQPPLTPPTPASSSSTLHNQPRYQPIFSQPPPPGSRHPSGHTPAPTPPTSDRASEQSLPQPTLQQPTTQSTTTAHYDRCKYALAYQITQADNDSLAATIAAAERYVGIETHRAHSQSINYVANCFPADLLNDIGKATADFQHIANFYSHNAQKVKDAAATIANLLRKLPQPQDHRRPYDHKQMLERINTLHNFLGQLQLSHTLYTQLLQMTPDYFLQHPVDAATTLLLHISNHVQPVNPTTSDSRSVHWVKRPMADELQDAASYVSFTYTPAPTFGAPYSDVPEHTLPFGHPDRSTLQRNTQSTQQPTTSPTLPPYRHRADERARPTPQPTLPPPVPQWGPSASSSSSTQPTTQPFPRSAPQPKPPRSGPSSRPRSGTDTSNLPLEISSDEERNPYQTVSHNRSRFRPTHPPDTNPRFDTQPTLHNPPTQRPEIPTCRHRHPIIDTPAHTPTPSRNASQTHKDTSTSHTTDSHSITRTKSQPTLTMPHLSHTDLIPSPQKLSQQSTLTSQP